ncbi:L,D-transpeptidase family protein [Coraliomargarita akajimensis]|uniref:Peptidoglycan-binding domain 1 protein n=1 Tax=Coraliomargarita akajimensis (strain DSM 45221 / IAM 15411 / JCM 23193 / KCTC 12865 / 04OKA010-24) TaxID=583355 RepID=D5EQ61_CORAD|nr:L,D-transpeptidase [Coraliomargarita akajimensis]ADE53829.1 Peptidoglycan-binding domain 1 protein [Coraliomargarita akajimensis DSM 45221]
MTAKKKTTRKRARKTARKVPARKKAKAKQTKSGPKIWLISLLLVTAIIGAYYYLVVRPAERAVPPGRPIANNVELQIALARNGFSPGSIDGVPGNQTRQALTAFQQSRKLEPSGVLDEATKHYLRIEDPCFTHYTLTGRDFLQVTAKPKTWREREYLESMAYNSIKEMLAERSLSDPDYIARLNPRMNWGAAKPGDRVLLPVIAPYSVTQKIARIDISLSQRSLQLIDQAGKVHFHCPVSIARQIEKRPLGDLEVTVRVDQPNYTFNPSILTATAEREGITRKFVIPPGPNNPVGLAWIGLNRPSYGIHGTPVPEQVGRTESSGCFRLANWNAQTVLGASWVGMPVTVKP